MTMLELRQVSKVYGRGATAVHALRDVSLDVGPGTMVAVTGPSGTAGQAAPAPGPGALLGRDR